MKKRKCFIAIAISILLVLIAIVVITKVIIPGQHYASGESCLSVQNFDGAVHEFLSAGNYKDSELRVRMSYYDKGRHLLSVNDYDGATEAFELSEGYSDAEEQIENSIVKKAEHMASEGLYDNAIQVFSDYSGRFDFEGNLCEIYYLYGKAKYEDGLYLDSVALLRKAEENTDALVLQDTIAREHSDVLINNAQVGDVIYWGRCEQDNNPENGPEQIAWKVISSTQTTKTLISARILQYLPLEYVNEWLTSTFYESAFSQEEQSITQPPFLLTPTEVREYLNSIDCVDAYNSEFAAAQLLAYAENRGFSIDTTDAGSWWLKTTGPMDDLGARVLSDGSVSQLCDPSVPGGIRPSIKMEFPVEAASSKSKPLSMETKVEIYRWIEDRYEFYDNKEGHDTGEEYTDVIFNEASDHFNVDVDYIMNNIWFDYAVFLEAGRAQ